jgi:F-type H+-transporting ATPase subunit b
VLIDWFTVIAQAVNFLILVWLLKRFFYQPILKALDARERRIAAELADADAKKREAELERSEFRQKNDEFDQQRATFLDKALDEARAERKRLIAAARNDADTLRTRREEALKTEYQSLSEALTRRTCAEVFAISRKVLADLANTTLEAHMAEAFIRRMHELNPDEKAQLASAFKTSIPVSTGTAAMAGAAAAGVVVRSAFDLPAAQQNSLVAVVRENLGTETSVRFETEPDLVSGIELVASGYKVAWSIAGYLASLEKEMDKLLLKNPAESESATEPESKPDPEGEDNTDQKRKRYEKVAVLKPRN